MEKIRGVRTQAPCFRTMVALLLRCSIDREMMVALPWPHRKPEEVKSTTSARLVSSPLRTPRGKCAASGQWAGGRSRSLDRAMLESCAAGSWRARRGAHAHEAEHCGDHKKDTQSERLPSVPTQQPERKVE